MGAQELAAQKDYALSSATELDTQGAAALFSDAGPHAVTKDTDTVAKRLATDDTKQPTLGEIL